MSKYSNTESVGRFMFIFMECRKDLSKKWCFLRSVGRVCVRNMAKLRVWDGSCTYLWNVGRIYAKMMFSMKCRKSFCLKNTAILRAWDGSCTYLRNVGRIYTKNGVFYEE